MIATLGTQTHFAYSIVAGVFKRDGVAYVSFFLPTYDFADTCKKWFVCGPWTYDEHIKHPSPSDAAVDTAAEPPPVVAPTGVTGSTVNFCALATARVRK